MEETIIVHFPGQTTSQLMQYRAQPGEGDDEVALRLSLRFKPGTVLGIDGSKWRVDGPSKVTLVYDPVTGKTLVPEAAVIPSKKGPSALYPIGSTWKPRDPRRKSSFKVVDVDDEHVHTDDGRQVQLGRMFRYDRID